MMYETRKEAADACKYEAAAAERFSTAAIRKASEGQCSAAWRLADQARKAAAAAVEKLNATQHGLPPKLDALCEQTGTRPEGIKALMAYYTENSGWTEQQGVEHIEKLFEDGTVEALQMVK